MDDTSEKRHFVHGITTIAVAADRGRQPYIDAFAVTPTNIIERDHGSLVGFFRLYDESEETAYVAHFLTSVLKKEFYASTRRSTEAALEAALVRVNTALSEFARHNQTAWIGKIDGVVAAFTTDTVCFSACGRGDMLLLRHDTLTRLTSPMPSDVLTTFTDIACGALEDGDGFIIASRELLEVLPLPDCERSCRRYAGADREQLFRTALVNRTDAACVHLVAVTAAASRITRRTDTALDIAEDKVVIPSNVFSAATFADSAGAPPVADTVPAPTETSRKTGHFYLHGNEGDTRRTPFGDIVREHTVALRAAARRQWTAAATAARERLHAQIADTRHNLATVTARLTAVAHEAGTATTAAAGRSGKVADTHLRQGIAAARAMSGRVATTAKTATIRAARAAADRVTAWRASASARDTETTAPSIVEDSATPESVTVTEDVFTEETIIATPSADGTTDAVTTVTETVTMTVAAPDTPTIDDPFAGFRRGSGMDAVPAAGTSPTESITDERPTYARHTDDAYDAKIASFFARAATMTTPTDTTVPVATSSRRPAAGRRILRRVRRHVRRIRRTMLPSGARLTATARSMTPAQRLRAGVLLAAIVLVPLLAVRGCDRQTPKTSPAAAPAATDATPAATQTVPDTTSVPITQTHVLHRDPATLTITTLRDTLYAVTPTNIVRIGNAADKETFDVPPAYGKVTHAAAMNDLNTLFLITDKRQVISFTPQGSQKFDTNDITFPANVRIDAIGTYLTYLYVLDGAAGKVYRFARAAGGFGPANDWLSTGTLPEGLRSTVIDGTVYVAGSNGTVAAYFKRKPATFAMPRLTPALHADAVATADENAPLYVVDRAAHRIVGIAKDGGTTVRNVTSPDFATARAVAVDERLATATVLLDDGTVATYKF